MEKTPVKFKQERDFGEVFNATFAFIGQEFKPLSKAILYFVLPILIVAAILNVIVGIEQQKFVNDMMSGAMTDLSNPFSALQSTYKYSLLSMIIYLIANTAMCCTVYGYIKNYVEKGKDQFTLNDVWVEVKKNFFPILTASVIVGILVVIGMVFCLIPGIYLGVSLSVLLIALMLENKGFGDAFSRSFTLTKLNWWSTFGILVVSYILIYLLVLLLSIPSILMGFKSLFTMFKNPQEAQLLNFSTGFYIMNSITSLITYILFSIPLITIAFQYFSLLEMKERPSLQDKIDQIS